MRYRWFLISHHISQRKLGLDSSILYEDSQPPIFSLGVGGQESLYHLDLL